MNTRQYADLPAAVAQKTRYEPAATFDWLADAELVAGDGSVPVVVYRQWRSGWVAALPLGALLQLLRGGASE